MNLFDARDKLAAALAPVASSDPNVLSSLVDSIEPPALMIGWDEPWMTPNTGCWSWGNLAVLCVASRLVPGEGVGELETLVAYTLGRLSTDPENWDWRTVSGPPIFTMAKTAYLGARISVRVTLA